MTKAVFEDAYKLCSDTLLDWKMIQQRANILNKFYARVLGRLDGFQYYKNASMLANYLRT